MRLRKLILLLLTTFSLTSFAINLYKWANVIEQVNITKSEQATPNKHSQDIKLLFVYSSTCGHCKKFAPVLKEFIQQTGMQYQALTADGGLLDGFEDAVYSRDTLAKLNVKAYPTVFAINQKTGQVVLFSQGNLSLNDLYENHRVVVDYMDGNVT